MGDKEENVCLNFIELAFSYMYNNYYEVRMQWLCTCSIIQ